MGRCGILLQSAVDGSRYTKDCVLQSAAFHHYGEAYTWPFHDIRLQLSHNQRYCTHIGKEQKGGVTQTVAFHIVPTLKLHFPRATDGVSFGAMHMKRANIIHVGWNSPTQIRLCQRQMTSIWADPIFQTYAHREHMQKLQTSFHCSGIYCNNVCQELYRNLLSLLFGKNTEKNKPEIL